MEIHVRIGCACAFEKFRRERRPVSGFCKRAGLVEGAFGWTMRGFFPDEWNELLDLGLSVGAAPLLAEIGAVRGQILYWRLLDRKDGDQGAATAGGRSFQRTMERRACRCRANWGDAAQG